MKQSTKLAEQRIKFCKYYLETGNGAQSYQRAFQNTSKLATNSARASRLLKEPIIVAMMDDMRRIASERAGMEVADVFSQWVNIATANPNDLIQLRKGACRYCYGIDNEYQWTKIQFKDEEDRAIKAGNTLPVANGGFGYSISKAPNASCPECNGLGIDFVYVQDTRTLTGKAKLLYAGIKRTANGPEVVMRDQDVALTNIARFLGMFTDKIELTGKDGKPIQSIATVTVDPIEAAKIYQSFMQG